MANPDVCSVQGCGRSCDTASGGSKGLCSPHYQRLKRHGDPLAGGKPRSRGRLCSVEGCNKKHSGHGYCQAHLLRFKKYGDATAHDEKHACRIRWIEENKDYAGDDCLKWPFTVSSHGRGTVYGSKYGCNSAPKAMCIAAHGEPPSPESVAAHRCGNGHLGCMNPRHIRWATHMENVKERAEHGRDRMGTQINTNKLTEAQVIEIRSRKGKQSGASLAREFGVSASNISDILRGKSWKFLL